MSEEENKGVEGGIEGERNDVVVKIGLVGDAQVIMSRIQLLLYFLELLLHFLL